MMTSSPTRDDVIVVAMATTPDTAAPASLLQSSPQSVESGVVVAVEL